MISAAHGENWEVVASRTVDNLVQRILAESKDETDQTKAGGKFELHYTPNNNQNKSYIVTLLNQCLPSEHVREAFPTGTPLETVSETIETVAVSPVDIESQL